MRTACLAAFSAATLFACSGAGNRSSTGSRQQAEEQELFYFYTCGDPVCHVEGGADNGSGLRACTTEQAGDPCDVAGDQCDPGVGCGVHLLCTDSDPTAQPYGCPISRASYKEGIEYLANEDLERYHDELISLPLATYRYKTDADARKHLGFMIDGHESLICVEAEHNMVDVYSYTSMAVAALKVQARQIHELRATVEKLERKLSQKRPPVSRRSR
ncbi:MAG TPA: hypothetical protein VKE49_13325 [Myxococcaceae bacterium]|nr:hypothetical protein [Myxococcaceae bacterium]